MAVIQQFRTAVRGFNRQDVQDYIEQTSAVHKQELAEAQKKLDRSEERVAELEEAVSTMDAMAEELSQNRTALDSSNQMVSRLRGELSQAGAKLNAAEKEIERLQAQVAALEPLATKYQEMKDHAASVELEAHQKAQLAVSDAKAEAEHIRAETRKWLRHVMEEYGDLRGGLLEMARQLQALADMPKKVEELDEDARQLREQGGLK